MTSANAGSLTDSALAADLALRALGATGLAEESPLARLLASVQATTLVERGDLTGANRALVKAGLTDDLPAGTASAFARYARGQLALAQRRHAEAVREFTECGRWLRTRRVRNPAVLPWRSHCAYALAALGTRNRALALADDDLRLARCRQQPLPLGRALRAKGVLLGDQDGEQLISASNQILRPTDLRIEQARSLAELGKRALRTNRKVRARELLLRAHRIASECGAKLLDAELRAELRSAGSRSMHSTLCGTDALTARERRVTELAGDGWSNDAIAKHLYLARWKLI
ncbi:hypothetical protein DMP23_09590 [Amycolatopsis sp. A1MSW2902]|uniref:hypothetical protein n=1 Tax=Amycolatopsis sp. A1MSW2902 TaxID=687413 RepID=UPI00307E2D6B